MPIHNRHRTADRHRPPPYLPLLGRHAHLDPADGACLMEYVAVLAGEPFSDTPACTHPVLAAIARLVNDATSHTSRQRLVTLAPDLAGATTGDVGRDLAADAALVAAALHAAAVHTGPGWHRRRLCRLARRAHRRHQHVAGRHGVGGMLARAGRRFTATAWRRGPAMHALTAAVTALATLPEPDRDTALHAMLTASLHAWRIHHPQPPHGRPAMSTPTNPPEPLDPLDWRLLQGETVLDHAAADLATRYADQFSPETVQGILHECYDLLAATARVHTHLPVLATRLATQRLDNIAKTQGFASTGTPMVLFVCTQNAGRSQLAAALLEHHAQGRVTVRSAGTAPTDTIAPTVVQVLTEIGADTGKEFPKPLTDDTVQAADIVVTMGCGDACPVHPRTRYLNWELPDPAEEPIETVRAIRDDIDSRVRTLLDEITTTPAEATTGDTA